MIKRVVGWEIRLLVVKGNVILWAMNGTFDARV